MDAIEKYIREHSSTEDPLLTELDRRTNLSVIQPRMISGPVQGKFLELLAGMIRPGKALEIGTFTGYSALCIAAGLPEGSILDTIEIDDELEPISSEFFAKSSHGKKITQHIGSALNLLPKLEKIYDMVFIDGDKREYPDYYRMLMGDTTGRAYVREGSYIIADNIIWYGKVASEYPENDRYTKGVDDFNKLVAGDPRVENVILDIRDGVSLIRVKRL